MNSYNWLKADLRGSRSQWLLLDFCKKRKSSLEEMWSKSINRASFPDYIYQIINHSSGGKHGRPCFEMKIVRAALWQRRLHVSCLPNDPGCCMQYTNSMHEIRTHHFHWAFNFDPLLPLVGQNDQKNTLANLQENVSRSNKICVFVFLHINYSATQYFEGYYKQWQFCINIDCI